MRWVGLIVLGGVFAVIIACVGLIVLVAVTQSDQPSGDHVAVVRVQGAVQTRGAGGLFGGQVASAETIIQQLEQIRETSGAKVVLLDINTPGGGVVATQQIYDELQRTRDEGIPIVAYMGDTATSAGYYISAAADYIIANPGTITGSIGAIASVPNYEELYEKLGIEMQLVTRGEYKDMLQPARPMTEDERALLQSIIDEGYEDFVAAVAAGRELSLEEARELADGRVYTGNQALELGLVDELGAYRYAIDFAGDIAGLGNDPRTRDYNPSPGFWDVMIGFATEPINVQRFVNPDLELDPADRYLQIRY